MSASDIIKGHLNEALGFNKKLSEDRLKICKKCPIYNPMFGGICNGSLYFNPMTNEVSNKYKVNYVKGCGCRLQAKTTLANQKCPAFKW